LRGFTFYSLFAALVFNKWGIQNISPSDVDNNETMGDYCNNMEGSIEKIMELLTDLDKKKDDGENAEFVKAGSKTTHSISNRKIRLKCFVKALQTQ